MISFDIRNKERNLNNIIAWTTNEKLLLDNDSDEELEGEIGRYYGQSMDSIYRTLNNNGSSDINKNLFLDGLDSLEPALEDTIDTINNSLLIDDLEDDNTKSLIYKFFHGLTNKYDKPKKSFNYTIVEPTNSCVVISRVGDFLERVELLIDKQENINEWLEYIVEIQIGGCPIVKLSIRYLMTLADKIKYNSLPYDNLNSISRNSGKNDLSNFIIIHIPLCEMFGKGRIDLVSLAYHDVRISVYNGNNILNKPYKIKLKYGDYSCELRANICQTADQFITLDSKVWLEKIDDCIMTINLQGFSSFIILWYVIDSSEFSELQSFQPSILKINVELITNEDQYFFKEIHSYEITKIKFKNYIGFCLQMNNINYNEMLDYYKIKTKVGNDKFFKKSKKMFFGKKAKLDIHWSNYIDGAKVIVEELRLNIGRQMNGMFGLAYSS